LEKAGNLAKKPILASLACYFEGLQFLIGKKLRNLLIFSKFKHGVDIYLQNSCGEIASLCSFVLHSCRVFLEHKSSTPLRTHIGSLTNSVSIFKEKLTA